MASQSAESNAHRFEGDPPIGSDGSPEAFLQPATGRIVKGAGLADGRLQQALKHHSTVARRIVLGRQILKIVGKSNPGAEPLL
jgi:hypothetical protein